ncbi:MAG TPA: tRNA epoxyqueuosine(34) reductase QueG [Rhodothermales bacterium]
MPGFDVNSRSRLSAALKEEARRLGFNACGISEARRLDEDAARLERWLNEGRHASMEWMERNFDKRVDPTLLVEGARSVVSVLHNYFQGPRTPSETSAPLISRYAWNDDYHDVMKERLYELFAWLDREVSGAGGRVFVDSAPVLEKTWAARSGLGWIGKNANLLRQDLGSFFFVGEMIVDVPLMADSPTADHCGSCTRCIDACPTGAIYEPRAVDANRCISYLTIEHRADDIAPEVQALMGQWIYGCDVCQDVCPWNKFAKQTHESRYHAREGLRGTPLREWEELDLEAYRRRFKNSAVKRAKFEGLKRNVRIAAANMRAGAGQDELVGVAATRLDGG